MKSPLINTHVHIFNYKYVPEDYLGKRLPFNYAFLHLMEGALWLVSWFYKKKTLSNYKRFVDVFNKANCLQVFEELKSFDKEHTKHIALAMDMKEIKGHTDKDIFQQIEELGEIKRQGCDFELFVAIDPTREADEIKGLLSMSLRYGAIGYKFYGSLGHLPSHPNMINIIIPFCLENNWPITAHCSSAITHSSKKRILVEGLDLSGKPFIDFWGFKKENDYLIFNDPKQWYQVLKLFPSLRVNFAHYGGSNDSWRKYIQSLMITFEGVYADLSYTFANKELLKVIIYEARTNPYIANRLLYGTDFFMVMVEGEYSELLEKFHIYIGKDLLNKLGKENPIKFLEGKK